ncbi:hypothetical protein Trydic_g17060 [Trypoxylus dichotomus]
MSDDIVVAFKVAMMRLMKVILNRVNHVSVQYNFTKGYCDNSCYSWKFFRNQITRNSYITRKKFRITKTRCKYRQS